MAYIMIDPGHGGTDPGAVNTDLNINEKDINLSVALKLGNILSALGHTVEFTRATDEFISLNQRAMMANDFGANYFISIHSNSSTNKAANGVETLYYRDNTTSNRLANEIQKSIIAATNQTDRGTMARNLAVLRLTKMPAVLIELGFVSNNQEALSLTNDAFQNTQAQAIADGIKNFLRSR